MTIEQFIEVGKIICTVILGGLAVYFKFPIKAQTKAKQIQETIAKVTAKAVIFI